MSRIPNTYLLFLCILLLTGIAKLHDNRANEGNYSLDGREAFKISNQVSSDNHTNETYINSSRQESETKFPFEIAEIQEIENEESPTEDNLFPFKSYKTAFLNAQLFNCLSFQIQKDLHYINYFDKSSTKLHARLQVFLI